MGRKKIEYREFMVYEYPRAVANKDKELIYEDFTMIRGDRYLKRVYEDGTGELTSFNEETGMWSILSFPAQVEAGVEDKIRKVVRHNFDVGVCVKKAQDEMEAA